ncbi:hypothetical protein ACET3Z_027328 [Daucus carota]
MVQSYCLRPKVSQWTWLSIVLMNLFILCNLLRSSSVRRSPPLIRPKLKFNLSLSSWKLSSSRNMNSYTISIVFPEFRMRTRQKSWKDRAEEGTGDGSSCSNDIYLK